MSPKRGNAAGAEDRHVRPLAYSLQFRGVATEVAPRVLVARASAPSCLLVTTLGTDGVTGRFETAAGEEAVLEWRLVLDAHDTYDETGSIAFGHRHAIRFRTVGAGHLTRSADPNLRHGAAVWEIEDGEGQFEHASGRITSNFVLSDTGEVTDNHLGLIFVASNL